MSAGEDGDINIEDEDSAEEDEGERKEDNGATGTTSGSTSGQRPSLSPGQKRKKKTRTVFSRSQVGSL